MATYVRLRDLRIAREAHEELMRARYTTQRNPYKERPLPDTLGEDATPWQIWFEAVDAANHDALKQKVSSEYHDLIDGREACPDCGTKLGYQPGRTREYMIERCDACGRIWEIVTSDEARRARRWSEWQAEHGEPRSLSEFWAMQAKKHTEARTGDHAENKGTQGSPSSNE